MIAPRSEIARLQSDFYRDKFRKILRWVMISIVIIYALIITIIYLILFQPARQFFANTTDGLILNMPKPMQVVR